MLHQQKCVKLCWNISFVKGRICYFLLVIYACCKNVVCSFILDWIIMLIVPVLFLNLFIPISFWSLCGTAAGDVLSFWSSFSGNHCCALRNISNVRQTQVKASLLFKRGKLGVAGWRKSAVLWYPHRMSLVLSLPHNAILLDSSMN